MLHRKYAGVLVGIVASLLFAGGAVAGQIGPNYQAPSNPGWNSPIWAEHSNGTTTFYQHYCNYLFGGVSTTYEVMHHWPFLPSTGLGEQSVYCSNVSTWYSKAWTTQSAVDYSVEYRGPYNVQNTTYEILYPGS